MQELGGERRAKCVTRFKTKTQLLSESRLDSAMYLGTSLYITWTTMDEPTISIYTVPMQQIRIKEIDALSPSDTPDAQMATISPELPPAYAVEIVGKRHTCTFFTRTAKESQECVDRISEAIQNRVSLAIRPDATVNRIN